MTETPSPPKAKAFCAECGAYTVHEWTERWNIRVDHQGLYPSYNRWRRYDIKTWACTGWGAPREDTIT